MQNRHEQLDKLKLLTATAVLQEVDMATIRARSLANLDRWNAKGTWVSAHDEWRALMTSGTDEEVKAVMTGTDQNSNRLRQSPPYAGLIKPETRKALLREVGMSPPSKRAIAVAKSLLDDPSTW
ncbi:hypothetical protein HAV22_21425 [Massilia sp. TW-1]|uniref:Uncharacterized protein n=1 Tax=Telluria antibiotica TaxID=2717319 RepID=A0ABX0PFK7_9BURK|nr:hypothetical protein [Telluria antibiotica]NIA56197.1 hypothetical protein [Telluria antibiotica]